MERLEAFQRRMQATISDTPPGPISASASMGMISDNKGITLHSEMRALHAKHAFATAQVYKLHHELALMDMQRQEQHTKLLQTRGVLLKMQRIAATQARQARARAQIQAQKWTDDQNKQVALHSIAPAAPIQMSVPEPQDYYSNPYALCTMQQLQHLQQLELLRSHAHAISSVFMYPMKSAPVVPYRTFLPALTTALGGAVLATWLPEMAPLVTAWVQGLTVTLA